MSGAGCGGWGEGERGRIKLLLAVIAHAGLAGWLAGWLAGSCDLRIHAVHLWLTNCSASLVC